MADRHILTVNSGSSSIKFSVYRMGDSEDLSLSGEISGIGRDSSLFHARDSGGSTLMQTGLAAGNHGAALEYLFDWLKDHAYDRGLDAAGHRVVHGGAVYTGPQPVTGGLVEDLRKLSPFAPQHLPHELDAIEAISRFAPHIKQVACFDTAFYRDMPRIARLYALPRDLREEGLQRYGFHGLSYEYITEELGRAVGEEAVRGRVIIAHLGHGASMTAVHNGRAVDTTMGFTPAGGLVMSTRCGDLDPGVILYLLEHKGMSAGEISELVNRRAGLAAISGISPDMKELLDMEQEEPRAHEAVELFCYQARKFLGGLVTALGGLDTLVFTGGIGENSPVIRSRICEGLGFMGIRIDPERNRTGSAVISGDDSMVTVRVIKTNEELMIARHTYNILRGGGE
ncbi:MAG: acetate/propionate family kinase [Deferribacteres bacterium]|nr:acetate/propionate family kinase [Deferribacteres bacterium]